MNNFCQKNDQLVKLICIRKLWAFAGLVALSVSGGLGAQPLKSCVQTPTSQQKDACDEGIAQLLANSNVMSSLREGWTLTRSKDLAGGPETISIMHPADVASSDFGLAGLSIRCSTDGKEILLILLEPVALGARPSVEVSAGSQKQKFEARLMPGRRSIRLSGATSIPNDWLQAQTLSVAVDFGTSLIRGTLPISGLSSALQAFDQSCARR